METSAFAKAPAFLLRRGLAALISHALHLCEIALLQKNCCHLKERAQHAAPLRYKKKILAFA